MKIHVKKVMSRRVIGIKNLKYFNYSYSKKLVMSNFSLKFCPSLMGHYFYSAFIVNMVGQLRGASPVNGSKNRYFFHHYSIAYAFRNTHVKFHARIRTIVEVMNFFVTSCSTSGFWN